MQTIHFLILSRKDYSNHSSRYINFLFKN
uniref:Uncharacterized protein n=1 Tax=Arundo donax TaxID=35708 RepID=A0A0A8ZD64_ARUDO